jgi:hypothetical protein
MQAQAIRREEAINEVKGLTEMEFRMGKNLVGD